MTLSIRLTANEARILEALARKTGRSKSEIVREAIARARPRKGGAGACRLPFRPTRPVGARGVRQTMNLIADTGLLMALLNQCDAHHDEAEAMVDHRDFSIYRLFGQQVVPIVCPA